MDGQRYKIDELLGEHGWELIEARKIDNDPWLIEMWLVKSVWSPTDCFAFFMFCSDEQIYAPNDKMPPATLSASLRKPDDWLAENASQFKLNEVFDDRAELFFGRGVEKNISQFFEDLAQLRQKYKDYYDRHPNQ